MKTTAFKNCRVVRSSWLEEGGRRLDCNPYMSGALEARATLNHLNARKDLLQVVTKGHSGGIYNGPMFKRNYVDSPAHGVAFLSSGTMLLADLSSLPLLRKKDAISRKLSYLQLRPGMTLISCSGTIGRMCFVRQDMTQIWSSQDVLKVVPNTALIPAGYLYAFLSSKYGLPLVVSGTYGAIIQHLEPEHISGIQIPRFGTALETQVDDAIESAASLRSRFQWGINEATRKLLAYADLEDYPAHKWNALPPETGFSAEILLARSLRATNYSPRAHDLLSSVVRSGAVTLGEICMGGQLSAGARFKRIDCEASEGVRLVGQKQGFWMQPEGRWISSRRAPSGIFASEETVLIASTGTLGQNEVYCRPILASGNWLDFAYSEHFLRVVSGDESYSGAYLYAYLRSELAFRALRSMSCGSKQQEIHLELIAQMPVPVLTPEKRGEITRIVREAFRCRDEADLLEAQAVRDVEVAIKGNH